MNGEMSRNIIFEQFSSFTNITARFLLTHTIRFTAGEIKYDNGMVMNYAYLTQRGYYPDQPDKANQDNYQVVEKFCDLNNRVR